MSVHIVVPDLGAGDVEICVSTWFVEPGDPVVVGDRLLELLIPGMTFDVPASCTGKLASIDKREGDVVGTGDRLGTIQAE